MAAVDVKVPDIGDFDEVAVIEVLVTVGDTVKAEQSLITVESDKASMEIPSSAAGTLKEMKVKVGDVVNIGDLIAIVEGASAASPSPQPSPQGGEGATAAPATPSPLPLCSPRHFPLLHSTRASVTYASHTPRHPTDTWPSL